MADGHHIVQGGCVNPAPRPLRRPPAPRSSPGRSAGPSALRRAASGQQAQAPIQIAWSGPLTGDVAQLGQGYLNGIKLAFDEWNAKGGVLGRKLTVAPEDDACDPKQAGTVATKIADDPKN